MAIRMRDELGPIFDDARFAHLFASRGRPAETPWRLALVTVLQFAEGLSDRQAAEAVRARIDWKYALGLELSDSGFDYSILSEFRTRLVTGAVEHLLLDALLDACKAKGFLKARGRQRTDSTHVLALVRQLSRIETIAETLRAALNAIAVVEPAWLRALSPLDWFGRYGRRIEDYRLAKGQMARDAYVRQVGQDGMHLLTAVFSPASPPTIRCLAPVEILRQVWIQQFVVIDDVIQLRDPRETPPASQEIESPYETEARFGAKRETTWTGYKVHLTESCDDNLPHLLTEVQTTIAPAADVEQLAAIQDELARIDLVPDEHLVDAGYVRAANLVRSRSEHQINLVGPIYEDRQWQAKANNGFDVAHFAVDWEQKRVTCPQGRTSVRWSETTTARDRSFVHVEFAAADCAACPVRAQCTRAKTLPRALTLSSPEEHAAIQTARQRQKTEEFAATYAHRAGIEGTISQGVRAFELRHARYRGTGKVHLQHVAIAAAINLHRLDRWLAGVAPISVRQTRFAALAPVA